jgi:hypothetical protein
MAERAGFQAGKQGHAPVAQLDRASVYGTEKAIRKSFQTKPLVFASKRLTTPTQEQPKVKRRSKEHSWRALGARER